MKKKTTFFILLFILAISVYFILSAYVKDSLKAVDLNDDTKLTVEIPQGSTTSQIGEILHENNLIRSAVVFKYYVGKINAGSKLKAGIYSLSKNMDTDKILKILMGGETNDNTVNITIVEGLTLEDTAQSLSEQLGLDYKKLVNIMENGDKFKDDYDFLSENPDIKNLQGYLMPDTYNVYKNSNEKDTVKFLLFQFNKYYISEIKPKLKGSDLNFEEIINLASIVEKEALLDEERPEIAATFLNRLAINMKLQSCATVNYAHGEWKPSLSIDDLQIDSPYNTYIVKGLPPGPINSPGRASINAVLEPADVNYLYFVAKGDGSHYFSDNYEDHLAAKKKYLD